MYTNGKTGARVAEAYDALATSNVFTSKNFQMGIGRRGFDSHKRTVSMA